MAGGSRDYIKISSASRSPQPYSSYDSTSSHNDPSIGSNQITADSPVDPALEELYSVLVDHNQHHASTSNVSSVDVELHHQEGADEQTPHHVESSPDAFAPQVEEQALGTAMVTQDSSFTVHTDIPLEELQLIKQDCERFVALHAREVIDQPRGRPQQFMHKVVEIFAKLDFCILDAETFSPVKRPLKAGTADAHNISVPTIKGVESQVTVKCGFTAKQMENGAVSQRCNIPNFRHDENHTTPSSIFNNFETERLPAVCGAIITPAVKTRNLKRVPLTVSVHKPDCNKVFHDKACQVEVPMVGPQDKVLYRVSNDFPDQFSSNEADIVKAGLLTRMFPSIKIVSDIRDRMVHPKGVSTFANRLRAFYEHNGGNFSIAVGSQIKYLPGGIKISAPLTELETVDKLSLDQLQRNACWELEQPGRQRMRQNSNSSWVAVPHPNADYLDGTDEGSTRLLRARNDLVTLKRYAYDKCHDATRWREFLPQSERDTKRTARNAAAAAAGSISHLANFPTDTTITAHASNYFSIPASNSVITPPSAATAAPTTTKKGKKRTAAQTLLPPKKKIKTEARSY